MKQRLLFFTGMLLILSFFSVTSYAQPEQRMMMRNEKPGMFQGYDRDEMLNLTDEQKEQIAEIRQKGYKETKALHDELRELKAHQQTLVTADNPDMKAINSNIDKISALHNQLAKAREKHHQEIRSLLTDEQCIQFDQRKQRRANNHTGNKQRMMKKPGKGYSRPGRF